MNDTGGISTEMHDWRKRMRCSRMCACAVRSGTIMLKCQETYPWESSRSYNSNNSIGLYCFGSAQPVDDFHAKHKIVSLTIFVDERANNEKTSEINAGAPFCYTHRTYT